ncbi:MAG: DMT family transporter [Candidatus Thorarchaeota archaeon]|nr:DMT family transporter [Candidatus Thorarchaeota archaeon]
MPRETRLYLLMVLAMFTWGGSWVSAKVLVSVLGAPPMTIGFFRFLVATVLFAGLLLYRRTDFHVMFSRSNLLLLLGVGLTGVFGYGVFFLTGMRYTTAAQGSIIAGINPATVSLFARLVHKERLPRRWQYGGFVVSFVGVAFVIGITALVEYNPEYLLGNIIIVLAMIIWGVYSSIGKAAMKRLSPAETNMGGILIGTLLFGIAAVPEQPWSLPVLADVAFWFHIMFLGVATTFVGFLLYFEAIKGLGITRSGVFINMVPVFGTLLSVIFLAEVLYWTFVVGLLLIIVGILAINWRPSTQTGTLGPRLPTQGPALPASHRRASPRITEATAL